MRYVSTRGGVEPTGFAQAVMMGLGTDGGLLLPETIPAVDAATLRRWARLPFAELAVEVMRPYVGADLAGEELADLARRSYAGFSHPEVTPLVQVGERRILELFHGPTAAFKDVALQFLGNLFELLLERQGGRMNILGATSGDTGSAAIYGVRGKERIHIFILHPQGRVSPIQERQMTTVLDTNVHNIAVQGTFDDGQRIVKELFNDLEFKHSHQLGAVNSINWVRVLAQTVYYFYAWGRVSGGDPSHRVSFAVPTGNFGDIFAGYIARRMGLPVERLILATNRNDILTRFVASGVYQVGEVYPTISPSMDIQVASNFERYLYYLIDDDVVAVRAMMEQLNREGGFAVSAERRAAVDEVFTAVAVSEAETLEQIRATYESSGYILDPHTAVGVRAASAYPEAICLATAHPAKFGEAVRQAIGIEAEPPPTLRGLLEKPRRCAALEARSEAVKEFMQATLAEIPR
jgi:threonine synthase